MEEARELRFRHAGRRTPSSAPTSHWWPQTRTTTRGRLRALGGATTIHSIGPNGGSSAGAATFTGISDDGAHVFFETPERSTTTDKDSRIDV
jgi:hypothetical protein